MFIRLGTRHSPLALWQAKYVSSELTALGHDVELVKVTTSGDISTTPLGQSGGQGVFTKEIQRALLDHRCDLAVHSLKDLPTEVVPELRLSAVPPREDACDCLVSQGLKLADLPAGTIVGTGSPRRKAQLLLTRPDLIVEDIRGNVETRLRKLDEGQYGAILLAFAGLHRLGLESRIVEKFTFEQMLPAVGQAALGLETRIDDAQTIEAVKALDHPITHAAVIAERTLLRSMRAGCLAPLAAHTWLDDHLIRIEAKVFSQDGQNMIATVQQLPIERSLDTEALYSIAEQLGVLAAKDLSSKGAGELIDRSRKQVS